MAGFEDLIRSTLIKSGNPTPERRQAIYQSSRQALERMLSQNASLDEKAIGTQRQRLEAAIEKIEAGYSAQRAAAAPTIATAPPAAANPAPRTPSAPPAAVSPPVAPTVEPQVSRPVPPPMPQTRVETPPVVDPPRPVAPSVASFQQQEPPPVQHPAEPAVQHQSVDQDFDPSGVENPGDDSAERLLRERKPYAKMLLWTIILVGIGVAIWWAITFGPAMIKQQLGGSVPNPGTTIESGSFVPTEEEGWSTLFNPAEDASNIVSGDRGTADLFQEGNNNFVRLSSNSGSSHVLKIKIPNGSLLPLQGKAATFEVLLRNPGEKQHQFAIFCEFASMGTCGRKRFNAGKKVEAFIFDVLMNDVPLGDNEDAFLTINPDLGGNGNALDLFAIRVRSSD